MRRNGVPCRVRERILSQAALDESGHPLVSIHKPGHPRTCTVHGLVMLAFRGGTPAGLEICHNNGVATDNRLENLRFDTHVANMADAKAHGTFYMVTKCPRNHPFDDENTRLYTHKNGQVAKQCRACDRLRSKKRRCRTRAQGSATT